MKEDIEEDSMASFKVLLQTKLVLAIIVKNIISQMICISIK